MNIRFVRQILTAMIMAALVAAGTQTAGAQDDDSGANRSPFVQRFDQDGDGLVSEDEFPGQKDQFVHIDRNGDGYIDASEAPRRPSHGDPGGDILTRFDANGDGQLSADEFPGPPEHFAGLDTDGDGVLTARELSAGKPEPPDGGGFENDDTDQDGRVSEEEFSGPAELFSRLDRDGDGYISRDEARSGKHPHGGTGFGPQQDAGQE